MWTTSLIKKVKDDGEEKRRMNVILKKLEKWVQIIQRKMTKERKHFPQGGEIKWKW